MPETLLLQVALQDGFFDDAVIVKVDGKELASRSHVTTKPQIGLALMVELRLAPGRISLQVLLAGRPPSDVLDIELDRPAYVGVSVDVGGTVHYTLAKEPFRYA